MSTLAAQKTRQALATLAPGELWIFLTSEGSDPAVPLVFDTALSGRAALMLHPERGAIALCANYDRGHLELHGDYAEIRAYTTSFSEAFTAWLRELAPRVVYLNYSPTDILSDGLTHGQYLLLEALLRESAPQAEIRSSAHHLARVRGVKTLEEVARLRRAIEATQQVYERLRSTLAAGQTEREIQTRMKRIAADLGVTPYLGGHDGPLVCINRVGLAHRGPTDTPLEPGDLLILDTGMATNGYYSDIARTLYVRGPGESDAPAELRAVFAGIYAAISAAAEALRPGTKGFEVDAVARRTLREHGLPELSHATGHQIGRSVHDGGTLLGPAWERYGEAPHLEVLAGQVFTLEPTVVQSPLPSMIVEENVLVTESGMEWLSVRQEELWTV
ncbi:Xaa-Pro aminopeptidase [Deinobacterium chartae]|uniref:Xaa-Pro aminopeptidase n=1 Tax=Deinobacterium chartae TaxID=521158 RepID=A0A841HXZ6_9DEIO|nr:M24 family metallopeptidase [Deinobacterium chartae]MBB6097080.1 Xaa-Pro aminopeptidase [Deinobacterium chartae]